MHGDYRLIDIDQTELDPYSDVSGFSTIYGGRI